MRLERLGQDVTRVLQQRSFAGIDEQQHPVGDLERSLNFPTEIGVAGRVDDVDFDAVVYHAGDLGEDGDAALALQLVRIHHAVGDFFVDPEDAGLFQHGVD